MRAITRTGICCCIAISAASMAPGAGAVAEARSEPRTEPALRLSGEERIAEVGSRAGDFFAGVETAGGAAACQEEAYGTLRSNDRPVDEITLTSAEQLRCDEMRILSGALKEVELSVTGSVHEWTTWDFELAGGCRYAVRELSSTVAFPLELLDVSFSGTAWRLPGGPSGCQRSIPVTGQGDLSDLETASPPYTAEVIQTARAD